MGRDEFENKAALLWVVLDLSNRVDEIGMTACSDAGVHLVDWGPVRRNLAFEELDCDSFLCVCGVAQSALGDYP